MTSLARLPKAVKWITIFMGLLNPCQAKGRARIFLFAPFRKSVYFCPVVFLYVQEVACLVAISSGDLRSFQIWFSWGLFRPFRCLWIGLFYFCNSPEIEGIKTVLTGRFLLNKKICIKRYC